MPILDLRLRKAVRHSGLRLVIASDRPTALDGGAEETARYAPGDGAALPRARSPAELVPTTPHARRRAADVADVAMPSASPASCARARPW